jgi:hypothetical protein
MSEIADYVNYPGPLRVMQKKSRPDNGRHSIIVEIALLAACFTASAIATNRIEEVVCVPSYGKFS